MVTSSLRVLVVVYSRTGLTSKIAAEIARRCGADVEELRDVRDRGGIRGYWRSAVEALRKTPAEIQPTTRRWSDYDIVMIGTPVWAGHLSAPMRGYLSKAMGPAKRIAFFCTMGGRGADTVFTECSELTHMTPTATLAVTDEQIARRDYEHLVDAFVAKVIEGKATLAERESEQFKLVGAH